MAKFCTHCGNELDENKKFCPNCGANIEAGKAEANTTTSTTNTGSSKSKMAAGLLGIFLGGLGVHNFYLGYTGKAVGQLLISILSCGFLSFISAIWGLIEGILILSGSINTDANGNPLQD